MKNTVIKSVIAVVAAAVAVYISVNIVYNLPEERYPDPLQPITGENTHAADTAELQLAEPVDETEAITEAETEAAYVGTATEAVSEVVKETATEAAEVIATRTATESVTESVAEAVTETITEPPTAMEKTEPTADFEALAEEIIGDTVKEAIQAVAASRIDGSFETFPFEKRDYRNDLSEEQQKYYDEMLAKVERIEPFSYKFSPKSVNQSYLTCMEDANAAYSALISDHPEFQTYFRAHITSSGEKVFLKSQYFLPSDRSVNITEANDELAYDIAIFDAVCDYIVARMPNDFCTYDKYRYLAAVVSLCTEYDTEGIAGDFANSAYSPIMDGLAVCIGYTVGFEYLCERADLYCTRTIGINLGGQLHMWNIVKLESGTYHVDVTWADNSGHKPCKPLWQRYFMLTQEACLEDHIISDGAVATGTEIFG